MCYISSVKLYRCFKCFLQRPPDFTCKDLGSHPSILTSENSLWLQRRQEDPGRRDVPKTAETGIHREDWLPWEGTHQPKRLWIPEPGQEHLSEN